MKKYIFDHTLHTSKVMRETVKCQKSCFLYWKCLVNIFVPSQAQIWRFLRSLIYFFIKVFQGIEEIFAQKCAFWVHILYTIYISQSMYPSVYCKFGRVKKFKVEPKLWENLSDCLKTVKMGYENTKIFTRHF